MPDYIAIPGEYSGDMWHVVAACLVREDLTIVVTILSGSDQEGAPTIIKFFRDLGLGKRLLVVRGTIGPTEVELDGRVHDISKLGGKRLMWQHVAFLRSYLEGREIRGTVHPLYRCTAMLMRAMEERGRDQVIEVLRSGLTARLSPSICEYIASYVCEILAHHASHKILFVLGRLAGYNVEHDLNVERLKAIAGAADLAGYSLVLVGFPKKLAELAKEANVAVLGYLDLRDWTTLTGSPEVDERARAYFWRCLVELAPNFGVDLKFVGGRSGSTDLPAFMGMDVLCWDICDLYNPEYLRLLLTARLLLWVTHVGTVDWKRGLNVVPKGGIDLGRDVLSFLRDRFTQPALEFLPSTSLGKKIQSAKPSDTGLTLIELAKEVVLTQLEFVATIVVVLPYDPHGTGQHFRTLRDASTVPLAFNALNHALRPYYSAQNVNLPDLGALFYFQDKQRRFIHEGTTALTMLTSTSPTQVVNMLVLRSKMTKPKKKIGRNLIELKSPLDASPSRQLSLRSSIPSIPSISSISSSPVGLLTPIQYQPGNVVRVGYHLYYDVVGTVTGITGQLVSVRVDHCYRPGTTTDYHSEHTAIVINQVMRWRPDQIDRREG